jgi:hypothetical protein
LRHLCQPIAAHGSALVPLVYDVFASAERLRRSDVAVEHCSAWRTVVNDYDFALMLRCVNEVVQLLEQNSAVVVVVCYENRNIHQLSAFLCSNFKVTIIKSIIEKC